MLLLPLVLIYLSSVALSTLISCLLSFLLTVTPISQVIFLPLMLLDGGGGGERRSAVATVAPVVLESQRLCATRHGCTTFTRLSWQYSALTTQQLLSPRASPPSQPKGNRVTREDRVDRNRKREHRDRLKRDKDDRRNKR